MSAKITICPKCNGKGELMVEYYKSLKQPHVSDCPQCEGTGRVVEITTTVYHPYEARFGILETICKNENI